MNISAVIYAFNVGVPENIQKLVNKNKIHIKKYNVIYHLIDDIKERINDRLPLVDKEEIVGLFHVFSASSEFHLFLNYIHKCTMNQYPGPNVLY